MGCFILSPWTLKRFIWLVCVIVKKLVCIIQPILELSIVSIGIFRIANLEPYQGPAGYKSVKIKLEENTARPAWQTSKDIKPGQSLLMPNLNPGQSLLKQNLSKQKSSTNQSQLEAPSMFGPSYKPKKRRRICKKCGMEFSNWFQYKDHRAAVHGENITYRCQICDHSFITRELLGEHKTAVHGQTSSFYCPICSRTFLNTQACRDHMASHQKIKRYECLICNMKFTYISSYRRHCRNCRQR